MLSKSIAKSEKIGSPYNLWHRVFPFSWLFLGRNRKLFTFAKGNLQTFFLLFWLHCSCQFDVRLAVEFFGYKIPFSFFCFKMDFNETFLNSFYPQFLSYWNWYIWYHCLTASFSFSKNRQNWPILAFLMNFVPS